MEMKFYRCAHCGQIIAKVKNTNVPIICCGEIMKEIIPGSVDAAFEKHVPIFTKNKNIVEVQVGETLHPMLDNHYIEWIAIQTKHGNQRKSLKPGDQPKATFALLDDDEVIAVFAYCNLHSLWKK